MIDVRLNSRLLERRTTVPPQRAGTMKDDVLRGDAAVVCLLPLRMGRSSIVRSIKLEKHPLRVKRGGERSADRSRHRAAKRVNDASTTSQP